MKHRHGSLFESNIDPQVVAWMKSHTVGDLRNLAVEMESKGENAAGLRDAIQVFEGIA
jgi:hypothetical protein